MNYDRVAPRLWMGGELDLRHGYPEFDVIVLCAEELQSEPPYFKGEIIHAPFDDSPHLTTNELRTVVTAALAVAKKLREGKRVLVTCHMGWNRSGLVTGLALKMDRQYSTDRIIKRIRQARGENALSNPTFVRYLRRFKPAKRDR